MPRKFLKKSRELARGSSDLLLAGAWSRRIQGDDCALQAEQLTTTFTHPGDNFSVATFNLAHGRGKSLFNFAMSRNRLEQNLRQVGLALNQQPVDFIALQESESHGLLHDGVYQARKLAQFGKFHQFVQGHHVDGARLGYGTALLSKAPLSDGFSLTFPQSSTGLRKGAVLAVGELSPDVKVLFISLHLDFLFNRIRRRQVEHLLQHLRSIENIPVVITGDFNCSGREGGAVDSFCRELDLQHWAHTEGMITFNKTRKKLDWILVSKELQFETYNVWPELRSDHIAVRARVSLR